MVPVLFGKYRLLRKIAQGGMAEIFFAKATGAGGFEKNVIVKRILPRLSVHDKFVRMFINEAKVSSLLSHSNIVQVFDFGRVGRDYFIAMEYLDGTDLRSIIRACRERNRRVPMEFVLYIGVQIAKALSYAHTRTDADGRPLDLIHRDVSPQNVLVSRHGEVKLTDFGIAKSAESLSETMANEIKGNFGYMPPEQAAGQPLDLRTDLYAAAMVLYELATLKNPFADNNLLVVIQRIREMTPPAPSTFNPAVSRTLDQMILKGLAKDPAARFTDAAELSAALSEELFPTASELVQVSLGAFLNSLFPKPKTGETPVKGYVIPPRAPAPSPAPAPAPEERTPPPSASVVAARRGAQEIAAPRQLPEDSIASLDDDDELERDSGGEGSTRASPAPAAPLAAQAPAPRPAASAAAAPAAPAPKANGVAPPASAASAASPVPRGSGPVSAASAASPVPRGSGPAIANGARGDARFTRKVRDAANLARLRLDVAPSDVEIFIDDNPIVVGAPIEIQTSAKVEHRLSLKAKGFSDFTTTFVLSPGEVRDFQIVLAERLR